MNTTHDDAIMITDNKLRAMLKYNLNVEKYDELMDNDDARWDSPVTFLISISTMQLSEDVLVLIKKFLKNLPKEEAIKYVNAGDQYNDYALLMCRDVGLMKIILKYVTNINVCDRSGYNALMETIERIDAPINLEMVELLLNNGINVNSLNVRDETALMLCCDIYHLTHDVNRKIDTDNICTNAGVDGVRADEISEDETSEDEASADEASEDETSEDEVSEDATSADETNEDEASESENVLYENYLIRDIATIENNDEIIRLLMLHNADPFIKANDKTAYDRIQNKKLLSSPISDLLQGIPSMCLTKKALRSAEILINE